VLRQKRPEKGRFRIVKSALIPFLVKRFLRFDREQPFIFLSALLAFVGILLGVMVLCACGHDLGDALFEFASALGTVGLSVGVTSAGMPDAALWAEIFAMFLGRLEFTVLIVSLLKMGRDSRSMLAGA
jgi:Trk-type K+ transport system membrane component